MDGIVFIDKDIDYTSKDISMMVGKRFNTTKVGHVGTLDPFASGLLMVMVNKATKTLICFEDFPKEYEATIKLGEFKDSMDITGNTVETVDIPNLTKEKIENTLKSFVGKSIQTVPLTSAVHVNGKRLYEYAHRGKTVELPTREIEVFDIKLLGFTSDEITFRVSVSKGTYIRVLGETIAEKLGTVGHLTSLRRTKILDIDVTKAKTIKELKEDDLLPIADIVKEFLPTAILSIPSEIKKARHGGKLSLKLFPNRLDTFCVMDDKNHAIAIYKYSELGYYECIRGIDNEDY